MRATLLSVGVFSMLAAAGYAQTDTQKPNHLADMSRDRGAAEFVELFDVKRFACTGLPGLNWDAENLDGEALFKLSVLYRVGQCVPEDNWHAAHTLAMAVNLRNTHAQAFEALLLRNCACSHNIEVAQLATAAAEKGSQTGQYLLADAYSNGKGVPQDYKNAARWAIRAANQGNVSAMVLIGTMYAKGNGVPKNPIEADKWFALIDRTRRGDIDRHAVMINFEKLLSVADKTEAHRQADAWMPIVEEQQ